MTRKYKLTSETTVTAWGLTLFRIEAVASFGNVDKGDKGGWIEKEENLSQEDNAWVYGDAWVFGNAQVSGNARVYGNAQVYGNAEVYGNAWVCGDARVYGDAWVYGNARVYGKIKLTLGLFFGWRHKDENLTFIDNGDGDELIGKDDCEFEYYEEEKDSVAEEAIKLLESKGYKIVKE